jgi:hypothetical protein
MFPFPFSWHALLASIHPSSLIRCKNRTGKIQNAYGPKDRICKFTRSCWRLNDNLPPPTSSPASTRASTPIPGHWYYPHHGTSFNKPSQHCYQRLGKSGSPRTPCTTRQLSGSTPSLVYPSRGVGYRRTCFRWPWRRSRLVGKRIRVLWFSSVRLLKGLMMSSNGTLFSLFFIVCQILKRLLMFTESIEFWTIARG